MSDNVIDVEFDTHEDFDSDFGPVMRVGGTNDYKRLENKPSINGTPLVENYDEIDPTVPAWAKEEHKPSYTPEEVGAISSDAEMSFSDIKAVWDSVFKK